MLNSPFVKNFDELFENIKNDIVNDGYVSLYIAADKADSLFEKLLVQELSRTVNNQQVKFIAIRDIKLKENYKGKKAFTGFVEKMETLNYPLMYHDIVNIKLLPFFERKGYEVFKERKYEHEVTSMIKLF